MKITLIIGPQASGKSHTARRLSGEHGAIVDETLFARTICLDGITRQTTHIIIEGLKDWNLLKALSYLPELVIKHHFTGREMTITPHVIITAQIERHEVPASVIPHINYFIDTTPIKTA